MPLLFDVTFQGDTDTRLRMEYTPEHGRFRTEYDCFRTETLAFGQPAASLWRAMRSVAPSMLDLQDQEAFERCLVDERHRIHDGAEQQAEGMILQPLLGRYLSILHGAGRHPLSVRPGGKLMLYWSGPGEIGVIHEDTIDTMVEVT